MSPTSLLDVRRLFFEPAALGHFRGREVFERFADAEKVEVRSHWNIPELNQSPDLVEDWNAVKAHTLVLGVKKGLESRPNGRSTDFIAPGASSGCAMSCAYCYVARRKGSANPVTVFANIDQILSHLDKKVRELGPKAVTATNAQTDPKLWTFDVGENGDCSVDDLVSDNVKDLVEFFSYRSTAKASFATKFVNRRLLGYDPKGKTRVRFSLMPAKVAKVVDVRTSPIAERIAAINLFVEAGYEVHVNLSPVILYKGWVRDYCDLFEELDDVLSPAAKDQLKAEVIFLTHNEDLHELNLRWHPKAEEQYLWRFGDGGIQERKVSENGAVNLRYDYRIKAKAADTLREMMAGRLPYCEIRYMF